eukprot:scaffold2933_cov176-Skeletonema_marinoi.AAC.3
MPSTTATTLASEARRLRLAGGRSGGGNIKTSDVVETGNHQPVNLSPAARRRLLRSQHAHSEDESYSGSATRELNGGNATKYGRRSQRRGGGHSTPSRSRESREDTQQLSLPVAESSSVDSDDNGTCFNSVGTASRHPSPKKNWSRRQHLQQNRRSKLDPLQESANSPEEVKRGGGKSIWDHPEKMVSTSTTRYKSSDNASVYSDYDQGGGRFHKRNGVSGGTSVASSTKSGDDLDDAMLGFQSVSPLKQPVRQDVGGWTSDKDTNDKVDEVLNKPNVKTALGVAAAATIGAAILGPVGVLVGAASVGIGIGVMQIPEEQRSNAASHASTSFEKAKTVALDISESVGKSCARMYEKETGQDPSEALGKVVPDEIMDRCCSLGKEDQQNEGMSLDGGGTVDLPPSPIPSGVQHAAKSMTGDAFGDDYTSPSHSIGEKRDIMVPDNVNTRRAACGRVGRVVPLGQIHSLRPSLQPRAWLDVMASAYTTRDDKNEAMQEILILAKDKEISRWFLEEGILDSLMLILSTYFRNYSSFFRNIQPQDTKEQFKSYKQGGQAFIHARLASNCCVALGKAHCAAVHTEGDMLLMSAYSRGSVPVQRQLAQMLFEVPHHMKVVNSPVDGTAEQHDAEFTLTELSMQQAEDLASSIKALDDGKIDFA